MKAPLNEDKESLSQNSEIIMKMLLHYLIGESFYYVIVYSRNCQDVEEISTTSVKEISNIVKQLSKKKISERD
jgi:uncharacterized protein (UPF0248 family)